MSRLEFAPEPGDMEVTDISIGRFVFTPVPEEEISLEALTGAVVGAGYEIESAHLQVVGSLTSEGLLRVKESGQLFRLEGGQAAEVREAAGGDRVRVEGAWRTLDDGAAIAVERWSSPPGEASSR